MIKIWQKRNSREMILIAVASILITVLLLWQFVYKPLSNYPVAQERAYKQAVLDLKIMQKGQKVLGQNVLGQGTAKPVTVLKAEKLQSTITKIAKAKGLKISRRQPRGDEEITMWLESADSKAFYAWVDELTGQYNIKLLRAQLNRNEGGTVRVQVVFILGEK